MEKVIEVLKRLAWTQHLHCKFVGCHPWNRDAGYAAGPRALFVPKFVREWLLAEGVQELVHRSWG